MTDTQVAEQEDIGKDEITYDDDFEILHENNSNTEFQENSENGVDMQTQNDVNKLETQVTTVPPVNNNVSPKQPVFVNTTFGSKTIPIHFTIIATGQTSTTSVTGGKLRMIYGRIYFLPVNIDKNINSDDYPNIKIFSDIADKIDVRYVLNGYAAIIPIQNNVMISDQTRLCILW